MAHSSISDKKKLNFSEGLVTVQIAKKIVLSKISCCVNKIKLNLKSVCAQMKIEFFF